MGAAANPGFIVRTPWDAVCKRRPCGSRAPKETLPAVLHRLELDLIPWQRIEHCQLQGSFPTIGFESK